MSAYSLLPNTHKAWAQLWESQKINSKIKSQWGGGQKIPLLNLALEWNSVFF